MTDQQISSLAKKYVDDSLAIGGASPSAAAYDAAIGKVETDTRKLLAASARRTEDGRIAVAC